MGQTHMEQLPPTAPLSCASTGCLTRVRKISERRQRVGASYLSGNWYLSRGGAAGSGTSPSCCCPTCGSSVAESASSGTALLWWLLGALVLSAEPPLGRWWPPRSTRLCSSAKLQSAGRLTTQFSPRSHSHRPVAPSTSRPSVPAAPHRRQHSTSGMLWAARPLVVITTAIAAATDAITCCVLCECHHHHHH